MKTADALSSDTVLDELLSPLSRRVAPENPQPTRPRRLRHIRRHVIQVRPRQGGKSHGFLRIRIDTEHTAITHFDIRQLLVDNPRRLFEAAPQPS